METGKETFAISVVMGMGRSISRFILCRSHLCGVRSGVQYDTVFVRRVSSDFC